MVLRFKPDSTARHFLACIPTLTLGIMGSAVLPVSSAFASTGIVAGFVIMVVVAAANAYTCDLLLWQAYKTGKHDYETLSYAVGGGLWKFITELSIVVLMVGTLVGGITQIGEAGSTGILYFNPDATGPMVEGSGRILMVIFVVAIVAPLCALKNMRRLEWAGWGGFMIVCAMTITIIANACYNHMPYVGREGEFAAVGFSDFSSVTGAVSTFGFVFYIQPIMMPLLSEMPATERGVRILAWSTRVVVLGISFMMYALIGFFGAADFGSNTEGNILENDLGGGAGQGVLNIAMSLYLALSLPPVEFPTRKTLDYWLPTAAVHWPWLRHILETGAILSISLLLALLFPSSSANAMLQYLASRLQSPDSAKAMWWLTYGSAQVLLVTGATGVMMASYVVPVVNHLLLYFGKARCQKRHMAPSAMTDDSAHGMTNPAFESDEEAKAQMKLEQYLEGSVSPLEPVSPNPPQRHCDPDHYRSSLSWSAREVLSQVCLPLLVLAVGMFCSIAALSTLGDD